MYVNLTIKIVVLNKHKKDNPTKILDVHLSQLIRLVAAPIYLSTNIFHEKILYTIYRAVFSAFCFEIELRVAI